MLLGIKDDEQDGLLSFLIDDTINMIMSYCHIEVLPRQLESLVPKIAADMYRIKGYGDSKSPEVVKSVSEIFSNYYKRLDPFRKRKGRVPSDVGI